ncbi:helix-turn-helix domain-containing protein [Bowdeniella nasicola]
MTVLVDVVDQHQHRCPGARHRRNKSACHQAGQISGFSSYVGLFSSHANELRKAHRSLRRVACHDQDTPTCGARRKAQRRLSDEQVHRIAEGYTAGKTVYELAVEFSCHRATVSAVLKRRGVALRLQPATKVEVERMIALYQSGLSLAAVGKNLGINASTVLKYLRANGVPKRSA